MDDVRAEWEWILSTQPSMCGIQVSARRDEPSIEVDIALGVDVGGTPIRCDTVALQFCTAKPLLAWSLLRDDSLRQISHRALGEWWSGCPAELASLDLTQLIVGRGCLTDVPMEALLFMTRERREQVCLRQQIDHGLRAAVGFAHQDLVPWVIADRALRDGAGIDLLDVAADAFDDAGVEFRRCAAQQLALDGIVDNTGRIPLGFLGSTEFVDDRSIALEVTASSHAMVSALTTVRREVTTRLSEAPFGAPLFDPPTGPGLTQERALLSDAPSNDSWCAVGWAGTAISLIDVRRGLAAHVRCFGLDLGGPDFVETRVRPILACLRRCTAA